MIRGLYTSGWSMLACAGKMDVIANNLANVNTNAYKKDIMVFESFPDILARRLYDTQSVSEPSTEIGSMSYGKGVGEIYTCYNQGQLLQTGAKLDAALQNSDRAFFTIGVPDENGELKEFYTRDGSFEINSGKQLVTKDGYAVMGVKGPIVLESSEILIDRDGTVSVNGSAAGRILVKQFTDTKGLRKTGSNLLENTGGSVEETFTGTVVQGSLEQSNVNIIREMVDMIDIMRSYEANQKMIQYQDSSLDKTVNEVGALR